MRLAVPYGKHFLETEIQEGFKNISPYYVNPVEDIENNLKVKVRKPTGSKPLRDLVCRGEDVCIIVPDKTRACPTKKILPIVIEEVEKCAPQEIAIVIGNGSHKSLVKEEIVELLGEESARYTDVRVNELADIVIVSNGGFPLDRDLYQAVKGMATAAAVVKEGGVIIMVAECRDGFGGHEEFKALMQRANPDEVLKEIRENEPIPDQWMAQILANILKKAKVIMVTKGIEPSVLREMMIEPTNSLDQAIELARNFCVKKPKVIAIPEGPYVIPKISMN
jgi:nickel-dependent lactate racemase